MDNENIQQTIFTHDEWISMGQSLADINRDGAVGLTYYDISKANVLSFREAQQRANDEIEVLHKKGVNKIVVSLSTGAGKTLFAYERTRRALSTNPNQTILFIVNRDALVQNARDSFEKELGDKVGIIQADNLLHLNRQVQ